MDIFNRFPFSNAHELNLDWILRQLKNLLRRVKRLEESGGGGTSDYDSLENKPQINGVILSGNKTTADLHLESDNAFIAEYRISTSADVEAAFQSGKNPIMAHRIDTSNYEYWYYLSERVSSTKFRFGAAMGSADGSHIHGTAVFLDSDVWSGINRNLANLTDVPDASDLAPAMDGTASPGVSGSYARGDHVHPHDDSKLNANQGTANAGKFMVVGSDGIVAPVTMQTWQGGNY